MRGKFITIEGCEGVGKSTQVELLRTYFKSEKIDGLFTREPGGTKISEQIREIILDEANDEMCSGTELLLYEAARLQHTHQVILPAIEEGKVVVCDRYIDSTTAYQAYARGLPLKEIDWLNFYGSCGIKIDATVFLDALPFENTSKNAGDRMEKEGDDFHIRVYEGFKVIAKNNPRFIVIKTLGDKHSTHEKIIAALKERGII